MGDAMNKQNILEARLSAINNTASDLIIGLERAQICRHIRGGLRKGVLHGRTRPIARLSELLIDTGENVSFVVLKDWISYPLLKKLIEQS